MGLLQTVFYRAIDEANALGVHFSLNLLTHGFTQEISFSERITGERSCNLQHLLLIDDDAIGFFQDGFDLVVIIIRRFFAMLTGVIGGDIIHRAGPIERHKRDDIFEPIGLHAEQCFAHALTFKLEYADRFALHQHFVGFSVVNLDGTQIDYNTFFLDEFHGLVEHR